MADKVDQALRTMINNMPEKTGKTLEQWKEVLQAANLSKHGEMMKLLKNEYDVSHGFANTIVALYKKSNEVPVDLVQEQYAKKESLYPIYKALVDYVKTLGDDITIRPKKSSVSLIRNTQFLLIKPATKTRMDLGLKLKGVENQGVLDDSGPFGSMCTHRIQLTAIEDMTKEVKVWIKQAYESNQ